jgi:hypothetical protein
VASTCGTVSLRSNDPQLTYAAMRAQVRQRLATSDPAVDEEAITDTCLAIAAFAHEDAPLIEACFPEPGERHLAMESWQDEIDAIRAIGERSYQEALQRGEPVPLAELAVNLRLWREFFQLPYER